MNLCEKHIGEAFPPRCQDCDLETLQAANQIVRARLDRNPPTPARAAYTSQSAAWEQPAREAALFDLDGGEGEL